MKPLIKLITFWFGFFILTSVFSLYITSVAQAQSCETRGVWLNPNAFNTATRRQTTLNKIVGPNSANLNTVFLASHDLGDNLSGWATRTDFEAMCQLLNQYNISVHAWFWNQTRPGYKVDFTSIIEQTAQAQWVIDFLNNYPESSNCQLDGIHFDGIRYDKYDVSTTDGPYAHLPRVDEAKTYGVTETVRQSYQRLKNTFPSKKLSAAVRAISNHGHLSGGPFPSDGPPYFWYPRNLPYMREDQQNAIDWVENNYIDVVIRMNYATDDNWWNYEAEQWRQNLPDKYVSRVYMGLGWYNGGDTWLDAPGIVRKINYGRTLGYQGFIIFQLGEYGVDDQPLVTALKNGPFKEPAQSCLGLNSFLICFSPTDSIINGNDVKSWANIYLSNTINLDINSDNRINSFEFGYLVSHWGQACRN